MSSDNQRKVGLNIYVIKEISKYLYDADHLRYCVLFGIELSHSNFKSITFFSQNLDKIHRYRGRNVHWLKKCIISTLQSNDLPDNDKSEYVHYQLTNAILATIINVQDIVKLADVIDWRLADYNCLPDDFYEILWPYVNQCSFYKYCSKRKWLLDHSADFDRMHINCLLSNPIMAKSKELMNLYARHVDWTTVDYALLDSDFIEENRNNIDARRFNETIEEPSVILKFIEIIDWTIMTASFAPLEELYNDGPINVPNPYEAIYTAITMDHNYVDLYKRWTAMPEPLQQYYTRFPTLWPDYLAKTQ